MILNGRLLVEVLPLADLYTVYKSHRRLKVFVHKGRTCVRCSREGVLLLVTKEMKGKNKKQSLHVDLYTEDFVLMTVDHIVPKYVAKNAGWSKAAIERLTNKQTMCDPCNGKKGHKTLEIQKIPTPPKKSGFGAIWRLVENQNIFNREISQKHLIN
jgi:5-methylcytosine-specific restriction endonuclease McrA